jgi:hypothetical protein
LVNLPKAILSFYGRRQLRFGLPSPVAPQVRLAGLAATSTLAPGSTCGKFATSLSVRSLFKLWKIFHNFQAGARAAKARLFGGNIARFCSGL